MLLTPKRSLVGLDIGTRSIKAVEFTEDKPGVPQVSGFVHRELTSGESLKDAVSQTIHAGKFKTRRVASAISGKSVTVRYITMPRMDDEDLKNLLPVEAGKYIPFEVSDSMLDAQKVETEKTDNKEMKVLLVAAKKSFVMEHIKLIEDAGLTSAFIDVDSFALGNSYELRNTQDGKTVPNDRVMALIDIGATKTSINIMLGTTSCFAREIYSAGNDFTEQLSKKLGLDNVKAEELKRDPGNRVAEIIESTGSLIEDLCQEIHLSFDLFENQYDKKVDNIGISGGGSLLSGIDETFERTFNVRPSRVDPLEGFSIAPNVQAQELRAKAAHLTIAAGLASRLVRG
ncbi:MAG: type IV pilus assembly protein PilM [Planctomycetota bacterium]|nr:type IV pilus assembly protein PilM [Planctomycetota bacterium]